MPQGDDEQRERERGDLLVVIAVLDSLAQLRDSWTFVGRWSQRVLDSLGSDYARRIVRDMDRARPHPMGSPVGSRDERRRG